MVMKEIRDGSNFGPERDSEREQNPGPRRVNDKRNKDEDGRNEPHDDETRIQKSRQTGSKQLSHRGGSDRFSSPEGYNTRDEDEMNIL